MLAIAQEYKTELKNEILKTWGNEKYWYYNNGSYFTPAMLDEDTWKCAQYVSINPSGEMIGYLAYGIDRECRNVTYLAIINFTDDKYFGLDVIRMIKEIFEKYRYRKINFTVVVGNPVEPKYDRLIEHCGGRIVGIHKEHVMLPDGRLYDEKMYEIFREDYLKYRKSRNNALQVQ